MKKIFLSSIVLIFSLPIIAQQLIPSSKSLGNNLPNKKIIEYPQDRSIIWSDDFSDPTTWVIDHDASACDLDWQIGIGMQGTGASGIDPIASSSYSNGCAMLDSDGYGDGSEVEDSWITTANPIDLSSNPNVVLQFETWYKSWQPEKCFIVTSTTNTDWPELTPDFDVSTNLNVYEPFPGISGSPLVQMPTNPTLWNLNITPSAGGESQVWVRFHWTGTWGYSWYIDDVVIVGQASDDVELNSTWLSTSGGFEYARTPNVLMPDTLVMVAELTNLSSIEQTNIEIAMTVSNTAGDSLLSETAFIGSLETDSTDFAQVVSTGFFLSEGIYEFTAVASSDGDNEGGENFENNTYSRNFEVTENLYSLDGIGVYNQDLSSVSYIGSTLGNGTMLMVRYNLLVETEVVGFEIGIHSNTNIGGQIFPFLVTEEAIFNNDMYSNRIAANEEGVLITQAHINNNLMYATLSATTLPAGVYYACVELLNGPNQNDVVLILDDQTVEQPIIASMLHYVNDGINYTNGNAAAIRLAIEYYPVLGCPLFQYVEYNEYATEDDGSCVTLVETGCLDISAINYSPIAITDNGSCEYETNCPTGEILDCNGNCTPFEWYGNAVCDNGVNEYGGYQIDLICYNNDGDDCEAIFGCTNPSALNYNSNASEDNGTCNFQSGSCQNVTFDEDMYLPDGYGVSYSTSITVDCFDEGQTRTDINDILSINVNLEHSYAGDLDMFITAPNGVQIQLFEQAGGFTWFGEASDQDATATNPGVGYDYGWSMNPTYNGTMADGMAVNTSPDPSGSNSNILNSNTYLPIESFNALIGTPINGVWTITITDNFPTDNGWIFSWGILFDYDGAGCTDSLAINYNPNAVDDDNSCEYNNCPLPNNWTVLNTDVNHSLFLSSEIEYNGDSIADGSLLGVFYLNDAGEYQCAGYTAYYGATTTILAMGDDISTPELDGFIEGTEFVWHLWSDSLCQEEVIDVNYSAGTTSFSQGGVTFVESSNPSLSAICQTINFPVGWFTFSTYIESDIVDVLGLFEPIVASIVIVKNNVGMVYLPEWNYNGIGDINNAEGFQVKTYNAVSLEICGTQISPENNPLSLLSGWNLISYTREEPADVVSIVASLVANNNLVIVKNNEGMVYLPEWDYNGIGDMIPTQGYQLKINQDAVLEFLSNSDTYE